MQKFEFKVVPAPRKGKAAKGIRGKVGRYANAMASIMNELGQEGWDYVRADTLEFEERTGLFGRTTHEQTMLVFRRSLPAEDPAAADDYFAAVEQAQRSIPRAVKEIEQPSRPQAELYATEDADRDTLPPAPELRARRGV